MKPRPNSAQNRGMTLIEAMMSMVVLLIGAGGIVSAQLMVVRHNQYAQRMAQASALLTDLQGSIEKWPYSDGRLISMGTFDSFTDTTIQDRWDMGFSTPLHTPRYSDHPDDSYATTKDALGPSFNPPHQGLTTDVDGDVAGDRELIRYWNVYEIDLENSGTPNGKLIQVIVRWNEPQVGFRQISGAVFKRNPAKVF